MIDLTELQTELATDPEGIGYTGDDVADADLLNTVRDGLDSVDRRQIPSGEIREAIDYATDWSSVSAALRDALILLTAGDSLDVQSPQVRAAFNAAFAGGTNSRASLVALLTRDGTRAEELWGEGARVTPSQVADARRLP